MSGKAARFRVPRLGLLGRFTLLGVVATVALGLVLGAMLESQIRSRAIADASNSAELVVR